MQDSRLCVRDEESCASSTPYAVITQVQSQAPDDGHISVRNMLNILLLQ